MPDPITPTRIIPAGETLPAPAATPPTAPPPPPPAPPAAPPPPGEWFTTPPTPPPVVHIVHLPAPEPAAPLSVVVEPAPTAGVRWWQTFRPVYNTACAAVAWPLAARWADVLADARTDASVAGAWVIALVPLGVVALVDNVLAVTAANSAARLWLPRIKAAASRVALWALLIGTAAALPVMTVVYVVTGVLQ